MNHQKINRRQFIKSTAALAGAAIIPAFGNSKIFGAVKRTAVDQVALGKTGLKLSRLGFGAGSDSGTIQRALGHEGFNQLFRYAYDQGITYIDTADGYKTHTWVQEAIKGLPRERLFIQSKMPGIPENPLEELDRYRQELGVDYIDSLLLHCKMSANWDEKHKRVMDALDEAKEKGIIRAHGVSCHSLPALKKAAQLDWVDVNLARINPQGVWIDTPGERWDTKSDESHVPAVVDQFKIMRENGHGIIGMKLIGNGLFTSPEDREKAIRFAMQPGLVDAVVIGFKSTVEIDEALMRINHALADQTG
jgi:aryl-alcohol dehydrogenase-like predicted oxidoreductase